MSARIIFDSEIKVILDAAEQLFCPQEGKGDDRKMYQTIFHTLEEVKNRDESWVIEYGKT
jgi:hypothetical protein